MPELAGRDVQKQRAASTQLAALGPEAAPYLLEKLPGIDNVMGARYLAQVIGASSNASVVPPVVEQLKKAELAVNQRINYETILKGFPKDSRDAAGDFVQATEPAIRLSGVRLLLTARDEDAMKLLKSVLTDSDVQVRAYAAYVLSRNRDADALIVLKEILAQTDRSAQPMAINGLVNYGEEVAFPILQELVASDDQIVRANAFMALGRFKSEAATEAIVKAAAENEVLRRQSLSLLYLQRTPAAARALGEMLTDEDVNIQRQALMRLQQMRIAESQQIVAEYQKQQAEKKEAEKKKDDSDK